MPFSVLKLSKNRVDGMNRVLPGLVLNRAYSFKVSEYEEGVELERPELHRTREHVQSYKAG